jgi:hypothetical protein
MRWKGHTSRIYKSKIDVVEENKLLDDDTLQENLLQLPPVDMPVTWILLKEHFKPISMHSHCALCTVTVQEKLFWIDLEVKGVARWD